MTYLPHIAFKTPLLEPDYTLIPIISGLVEMGYKCSLISNNATFDTLSMLQNTYPKRLFIYEYDDIERYKKADMVFYTDQNDATILDFCDTYKLIPIAPEHSFVVDYNAQDETGTGFTYHKKHHYSILKAIFRAEETWRLSYDWRTIQHNINDNVAL